MHQTGKLFYFFVCFYLKEGVQKKFPSQFENEDYRYHSGYF
jgi:hypothetical protein